MSENRGRRVALGRVRVGDGVDDALRLFVADLWVSGQIPPDGWTVARTLVVIDHVPEVVAPAVVRLAHAHRVVREVHVAVVAYVGLSVEGSYRRLRGSYRRVGFVSWRA